MILINSNTLNNIDTDSSSCIYLLPLKKNKIHGQVLVIIVPTTIIHFHIKVTLISRVITNLNKAVLHESSIYQALFLVIRWILPGCRTK